MHCFSKCFYLNSKNRAEEQAQLVKRWSRKHENPWNMHLEYSGISWVIPPGVSSDEQRRKLSQIRQNMNTCTVVYYLCFNK